MAGGGIKPGITIGETDDYGYNITEGPVHVHDLNATILRCLGIDHRRLTYKYQGRNFRLTDTAGRAVQKVLTFAAGAGAQVECPPDHIGSGRGPSTGLEKNT